MEDILSSIKRIIAEENEPPRARRGLGSARAASARPIDASVLELSDPIAEADEVPVAQPDPTSAPVAATAPATAPTPPPTPARDAVSAATVEAARGALDSLTRLVVKPDQPGSDTLEGLVREMLRPMLAQWLDANLPTLVEQMVAREIARITAAEL